MTLKNTICLSVGVWSGSFHAQHKGRTAKADIRSVESRLIENEDFASGKSQVPQGRGAAWGPAFGERALPCRAHTPPWWRRAHSEVCWRWPRPPWPPLPAWGTSPGTWPPAPRGPDCESPPASAASGPKMIEPQDENVKPGNTTTTTTTATTTKDQQ